jgi:hypothetical protein
MKSETGFVISVEFCSRFQQPAFNTFGIYTYGKQLTWLNDLETSLRKTFFSKKNTTFKVVGQSKSGKNEVVYHHKNLQCNSFLKLFFY